MAVALSLPALATQPSDKTMLADCGESAGRAFYPNIGLGFAPGDKSVWTDDRVANGRIRLVVDDDGRLDMHISDASGETYSARKKGGEVRLIGKTSKTLAVLVGYRNSAVEIYTFFRNADGGAEVMWTANVHSAPTLKAAVFTARCRFLALD